MNITEFREKVLTLKLNQAEIKRIKELGSRHYKYLVGKGSAYKEINYSNFKVIWHKLNETLAAEDKFHRIQTHEMRNSKGFVDYSHLAYNGSADDL